MARIASHSIYVEVEFESDDLLSLEEFVARVMCFEQLPADMAWSSPMEVMQYVCS